MIKWIFKLGIAAMAIMFVGVYFIRATESTGIEIETVEEFKENNKATVESADRVVKFVEKEVKNFEWEEFKNRMSNLFESFKGDVKKEVDVVQESQNKLVESIGSFDSELEEFDETFEQLEEELDQAMEDQVDYQEKIDMLEGRIQEVLKANSNKDKKRLRLVNAKKIAKLEKRLYRTKDPVKKEKLRDLIKALSGED